MLNPLSVRIPDELREKLDGACKRSGRSLTQEVTKRLNNSFAIKAERDPKLGAIQYLVGQAALFTGEEWKISPWMFQAFRAVVSYLLERFAPPGEPIPPETAKLIGAKIGVPPDQLESMTPEGYGFFISSAILTVLRTMPEPLPGMSFPSGAWPYAMPHAREALGIPWDVTETAEILARIAANTKEDTPQ
jgi:TraY domain-containing protein